MMAKTSSHKVFSITELLEEILLQTDLHTLLISAQRVCRRWYGLIQDSDSLQAALFFKPANTRTLRGEKSLKNPFIEENIWFGFFRKQLHSHPQEVFQGFPLIDPKKEDAYLRKGASWRRMLLKQPPSNHIGIIETENEYLSKEPLFSQVLLQPFKYHHPRRYRVLGDIYTGVKKGIIVPGQDPLVFWFKPQFLKQLEPGLQYRWTSAATSNFLIDCDVIYCCGECHMLTVAFISAEPFKLFEDWLESLGIFYPIRNRRWVPLRDWSTIVNPPTEPMDVIEFIT